MKDNNTIFNVGVLTPPSLCVDTTQWLNSSGVVSTGNNLTYSSTPIAGWNNTINSLPISSEALSGLISFKTTIALSSTEQNASAFGFGVNESSSSYIDVDASFIVLQRPASNYARLYIYQSGNYQALPFNGVPGDLDGMELEIQYNTSTGATEYFINGSSVYNSTIAVGDVYMDNSWYYQSTSWNGSITLNNIEICQI